VTRIVSGRPGAVLDSTACPPPAVWASHATIDEYLTLHSRAGRPMPITNEILTGK
jgi:hypothetical protein